MPVGQAGIFGDEIDDVHAESVDAQFVGSAPGALGSMPYRGGRHQYQSRFGLVVLELDSTNQGCSSDVWLTTISMIRRIPRSCTERSSLSSSSRLPKSGSMS